MTSEAGELRSVARTHLRKDMNVNRFEDDGFAILPSILTDPMREEVSSSLARISSKGIGSRSLLELPWCVELSQEIRKHRFIAALLPDTAVAVQCTYFEKSQDRNWLVPIHQDLSIPVAEKVDNPALMGWSEKQGSVFVQPPATVLQDLLAVRLHVDECGADDGPIRVVPGSHRFGRLSNEDAIKKRREIGDFVCTVERGGVLLMQPLLLHASSKSHGHSRRRVLHFVFGPSVLPFGLRWPHGV